jgi:hypothetical protein
MKKTNKIEEDKIEKLIREDGLLYTSPDFTSRVMQRIEASPAVSNHAYQPLIGIKGWAIISSSVLMLIICCIIVLFTGNYVASGYDDFLKPVFGFFRNLEFSLNINLGSVFIGAMVLVSITILLSVDFVFNTKISLD